MLSRQTVICAPKRTAVGAFGGAFKDVPAQVLAKTVVRDIIKSNGLSGSLVEDLILANCYPTMDAPAFGRVVALDADLPISACGIQIDRRCGSGLQAVIYAAMQVATGGSDFVIAGGAESMSRAPFYNLESRWGTRNRNIVFDDALLKGRIVAGGQNYPITGGMIETAENLRREFNITRDEQDELAARSQDRANAAQQSGRFAREIVPVTISKAGQLVDVDSDEHVRPGTSVESLSKLRPIRLNEDPSSTVTAGNASGQNDGAAACIVTTRQIAEREGLQQLFVMKSWALVGLEPSRMGLGPVAATERALSRAGLTFADIDLIELNEAFAAQVLACTRALGLGANDHDRINVNGSGISLGHPVGATGARILTTLLTEMTERNVRFGLETMCIGGGQGLAAIFERL